MAAHILTAGDMLESTFLRSCDVLGLDVDTVQIARPAPPLSSREHDAIRDAIDRCDELGLPFSRELEAYLAMHDIGEDRTSFDELMAKAQKHIYAERIRRSGFDPDLVLGSAWHK